MTSSGWNHKSRMYATPLVVVLGPTAAGKSALAVALAEAHGGEVVSADAMAVYRRMDLGTAKPTAAERRGVPHHCIDCLEPQDGCDASRWLALAETAIAGIRARDRLPIIAGGSPLYVKVLLEGLSAGVPRDDAVRARLHREYAELGGAALFARLQQVDPGYAAQRHANDERRLVRALEVFELTGQPYSSFHVTDGVRRSDVRTLLIGLRWEQEALHRRINARAKAMFAAGLIDEVAALRDRLGKEARQAVGYKEVLAHLEGAYDAAFALYQVQKASRQLAKQQRTWFRRFRDIRWLDGDRPDLVAAAAALVAEFLGEPARATPPVAGG